MQRGLFHQVLGLTPLQCGHDAWLMEYFFLKNQREGQMSQETLTAIDLHLVSKFQHTNDMISMQSLSIIMYALFFYIHVRIDMHIHIHR